MKVQDNKLFVIEPKKGKMQPGESQVIKFTYRHTMAGTDRLPILFKVARGREILVSVSKQWDSTFKFFILICQCDYIIRFLESNTLCIFNGFCFMLFHFICVVSHFMRSLQ